MATKDEVSVTSRTPGSGDNATSTWSRASSSSSPGGAYVGGGLESPFGLRRRVRAVLQKAKDRTGIRNYNTEYGDDAEEAGTVAEAASIGGFETNTADLEYLQLPSASRHPLNGTGAVPTVQLALSPSALSSSSSGLPKRIQDHAGGPLGRDTPDKEPLPFVLPTLTADQERQLARGERVQEQSKMGREGSGYVVMDIDAPPQVIWECLLDFEAYPENIGTVKHMTMFTHTHLKSSYIAEEPVVPGTDRETRHYGTASVTRASFVLSKFHLKIAAMHKYRPHPDGHYMVFTLDPACKNLVMKDAKGIWYTQTLDGGGKTRVWLLCELKVAPILPSFIVDYAAKRAMPRATTWLPPLAERMAKQWLLGPSAPRGTIVNGSDGASRTG
jgi:hypothetical protein